MKLNNKGITMISLVITIIVLIIITSVSASTGINVIRESKFEEGVAELKIMQNKVNELYDEWKDGDEDVLQKGQALDEAIEENQMGKILKSFNIAKTNNLTYKNIGSFSDYRYFSSDYIKQELGVDGINRDFIISIEHRTIIIIGGIKRGNETYYSLNEIEDEQYNVEYIP